MPKKFLVFLTVIQALVTLLHFLAYKVLLTFFPALYTYSTGLLVIFLIASISFLGLTLADHFKENFAIVWSYRLSSFALMLVLYFLIAAIPFLLLLAFNPIEGKTLGELATGLAAFITLSGFINARIIRVTKLKVKLPNLPDSWKYRTAVVASDLHLGHVLRKASVKKMVKKIRSLNPDIVFIPGDFFDGVHTDFAALAGEFKTLNPKFGIFFCSGNHEVFAGYGLCEQAIKKAGIKILENKKEEVEGLQIAGLAYAGDPGDQQGETDESVKHHLNTMNIDPSKPSILLKHVPNHVEVIEQFGINLQVSGHSHHGQTWPGSLVTKKVWKGFDYGLKQVGKLQVYTSSGVGTWGPPIRFLTKSEIVYINFD